MVGCETTSKRWRLWNPAELVQITDSAGVSFHEIDARDIAHPVQGSDHFLEPGQTSSPASSPGPRLMTRNKIRQKKTKDRTHNTTDGRPCRKKGGPSKTRDRLYLFTTAQVVTNTKYALDIGGEIGNLG